MKRTQQLFSNENKPAIKELSYFQLSKILSDLAHFPFNGFHVAMALLERTKIPKGEEGAEAA